MPRDGRAEPLESYISNKRNSSDKVQQPSKRAKKISYVVWHLPKVCMTCVIYACRREKKLIH